MKNDLLEVIDAVIDGTLDQITLQWDEQSAVCVVLASGGYPASYPKGIPISGLDDVQNAIVFHAGTAMRGDEFVTSGGRVLGVTALGDDIGQARKTAYEQAGKIHFAGVQYRKDIGIKS